jgi:hypothetical protein
MVQQTERSPIFTKEEFCPNRSLRQASPHYLFLLCAETLSSLIRKEEGWSPKGRTILESVYDDLDEKASRVSPHMCGTWPRANVDSLLKSGFRTYSSLP